MRTRVREVDGIDWNDGAVCNAEWSGPLLKDVLETAGVKDDPEVLKGLGVENGHCWFDCDITKAQDDELYGVSVDLKRCLDAGMKVILALKVSSNLASCLISLAS